MRVGFSMSSFVLSSKNANVSTSCTNDLANKTHETQTSEDSISIKSNFATKKQDQDLKEPSVQTPLQTNPYHLSNYINHLTKTPKISKYNLMAAKGMSVNIDRVYIRPHRRERYNKIDFKV